MKTRSTRVAWLALFTASCFFDPVDYTGKTCPCPAPDFVCNEATSLCEPSGGPAGTSSTGGACAGVFVPERFRTAWTTPNTIAWQWDAPPKEEAASFGTYRIVIGTSQASVVAGNDVVTFGPNENPELGQPGLTEASDSDRVERSITDGLAPGTTYFGMLVTTDNAGCEQRSTVIEARTGFAPGDAFALFVDDPPDGVGFLPATVTIESCAVTGSQCVSWTSPVDDYENVRLQFTADPSAVAGMSVGDFDAAFLEIRVGTDATVGPAWGDIRLGCNGEHFSVNPMPFRANGTMRTYQIPLRVMANTEDGAPLTRDDVATGASEFGVGSAWSPGAHVWMDDVYLRW